MIECRLTQHPIFIVDQGRSMSGLSGVTQSGPLLVHQYYHASKVLQQSQLVAMEISGDCEFLIHQPIWITVCGEEAQVSIDEQYVSMNQPLLVKPGQPLRIKELAPGTKLIIGLKARLSCMRYFDSICGVYRERFGGVANGKPMITGDIFHVDAIFEKPHFDMNPTNAITPYQSARYSVSLQSSKIDFVPNYQYEDFSLHARYLLTEQTMQVSNKVDRMGLRLICDEPIPAPKQTASQALALGVIQIPPDGQPIVMGPDRQTHGGYPVIGTVPDYALAQLAQIPATKHFHFNQISIEQAIVNFTLYQSQY